MEGEKESPEYSVYAVKNTRRSMEDRHVVIPNLLSQFKDKSDDYNHIENHYSYYAIFDGHGGSDAAEFAADNLHKNMVENRFFKAGYIEDSIRMAYAATDFQYTDKSLAEHASRSGCTAVTCVLENRSRLFIHWAGDSMALVSRNGKPFFITNPHNLEREDEKERVEEMGGTVLYLDTWRVNGTLGVSRAIGDPDYKPYVTSDPDFEVINLDGTEDFVIMGCDGLWDRMTPEDAIGLIYEHLQKNSDLSVNELVNSTAQILSDKSIKDGSCDNVTTIVIFLKDVSSIVKSIGNCVGGGELSSSINNSTKSGLDNNGHIDCGNGNNNIIINNGNGLEYHLDNNGDDGRSPIRIDNGLMSEEVIGSGGFSVSLEEKKKQSAEGGGGGDDDDGDQKEQEEEEEEDAGKVKIEPEKEKEEKEKEKEKEKVNLGSTLNPFADEFQPNISNIIGSDEVGNEPRKDDEESNKNEKLDKKDLWMSEFKDDGNNDQLQHEHHQQQQQQQHQEQQEQQHKQEDYHDQYDDDQKQQLQNKKIEMFDGLVDNNVLSDSENFNSCNVGGVKVVGFSDGNDNDNDNDNGYNDGDLINQQSISNLSSSEYSDNLSSEMIIHDIGENKTDFQQLPSAPELVYFEQQQDQREHQQQLNHQLEQLQQLQELEESEYSTMESNLISQAETFVSNLTPNEIPSSPTTETTGTTSETVTISGSELRPELKENDCDSQLSGSGIDVNQYITSVSDGMVSEPYHGGYFGADSIEPQSIIVNQSNDVISSGPHAIDPYSEINEEKMEKEEQKEEKKEREEKEERAERNEEENTNTGKINIEDTQSIPLESLNPFDKSVDISTGDETKGSTLYEDNPDNSCGLLDFSDDQVNTIVITPNVTCDYIMNESKLTEDVMGEKMEQLSGENEMKENNEMKEENETENDKVKVKEELEEREKEKEKEGEGESENINDERIEKGIEEMRIYEAEEIKAENSSSIGDKSSQLNLEEEKSTSNVITSEDLMINQDENIISQSTDNSSQGVEIVDPSNLAVTAAAAAVGVISGSVAVAASEIGSKSCELVKKETISKTNVSKKSTLPPSKSSTTTSSSRTAALKSTSTVSNTRKPLAPSGTSSSRLTSTVKSSSSSTTGKLATSRQPTSTSTLTSNVRNSTSTSRVGSASTLNKRPTQTLTASGTTGTSSTTSRVSSLASRTTTSTSSSSRGTSSSLSSSTTSKPLTRTTTGTSSATSGLSKRPGTSSSTIGTKTTTGMSSSTIGTVKAPIRSTLATSRTNPSSTLSSTTGTKPSTISKTTTTTRTGTGTGTGIGATSKSVAPSKRASTGTMLNRPSPGASSSLINKSTTSALNRSLTNSSSSYSRPGVGTTTLSKSSTRPSTTSSSLLSSSSSSASRAPLGGTSNRTLASKNSTSKPTKSTTSTTSSNKVAVPRLGGKKMSGDEKNRNESSSASPSSVGVTGGDEGNSSVSTMMTSTVESSSNYSSEQVGEEKTSCSTPVDAITSKREKNLMPNSANSLKDELEAALASPISCEDKSVIKETKDDEPSGNL
ncbi:serine-rich adhesin for platelets-like [Panonychus citri]|uniref:serine-rich adhesin for platelets-like n=1 Tax=Panonychus citri TaxID=50023 RepID=UPI002307EA62|nr:serine-rich adhesin for platelets-like [Panonychus citri]XP_053213730.1 serine-rich adhesin for platelets-like [Panonychus citri]XP_053213731.1 serine-rich adhesin for platelets-like [Panonychus citri]